MVLPALLIALIANFVHPARPSQVPLADPGGPTFTLRHVHATTDAGRVLFGDVTAEAAAAETYTLSTLRHPTYRPRRDTAGALGWEPDEVEGPNVTSRHALRQLAKMTSNAYLQPQDAGWYALDGAWNDSMPFGWEEDAHAVRGHIFATADNATVVVAIKGTSIILVGGGSPTVGQDKRNDNLLFSCCCATVGFTWKPVCGCYAGGWRCDKDCLEDSLVVEDSLFFPVGTNLYNNVSYLYPEANIWIVGHSLGGALASLMGVTFGAPAVAFESPGERLAAERLHLPTPPSVQHVTHVYHTADPVAMGTCNGVLSSCAIAGYAFESRCHLGKAVVYDTVTKWGWRVGVWNHGIMVLIDNVLNADWEAGVREVPEAKFEKDCIECYSWEFGNFFHGGNSTGG